MSGDVPDPYPRPQTPGAGPLPPASFGLRFERLATIATSSTARVDLCRSLGPRQTGQLIAVKRLLPDMVDDEALAKRFLDEVWMTAALRDPNVVSVVGWGQDERGPYLASELVQGVSLARLSKSVVETGEEFPERLVVYIGLCVARGLAAAHELKSERGELLNLVHRDLSAHNVLVGFQGEVKVADFGLAKAKDRLTVTTSELPQRTMGHVAPEELEQKPVDHRSDIFGFGVMLFEVTTNKRPFSGKDEIAVLEAVLKKPAPDPLRLRPKMDRSIAALILQCLEKDPTRRPASAREIARVLEEWAYVRGHHRDATESLARFVRRNSMRQMRWFENAVAQRAPAAPSPQVARQPSLYPLHERGGTPPEPLTSASRGTADSVASESHRRDNEPTVVGGRRSIPDTEPEPAAKKPRPADLPTVRGRRYSSPGVPRLDAQSHNFEDPPSDEFDEIPTVALKVDRKTRAELRDLAQKARGTSEPEPQEGHARAPLETVRMEDVETSLEVEVAGADVAPAAPPAASPRALAMKLDGELARLRQLAGERHETARVAREAAHRAALAADEAEANARSVERAIAGIRAALELVSRGDAPAAARKLDEALAAAGLKR